MYKAGANGSWTMYKAGAKVVPIAHSMIKTNHCSQPM